MFPTTPKFLVVSVVLSLVAACGGSDPSSNPPPPPTGPAISFVSPNSGPKAGGTTVTITGARFAPGATVNFGMLAASVTSITSTQIVAVTPASTAGNADVIVANPDHQSATLKAGFTYIAPTPQELARSIMGANFFGVEENAKYFGLSVSPSDPKYYHISYAEATLRAKASTHMLVLVLPGLSINDLVAKLPAGTIALCDAWHAGQGFASYNSEAGWFLVRKDVMPGSLGLGKYAQNSLFVWGKDWFPSARVLAYALAGHVLATGEVLMPGIFGRTMDSTSPAGTTYLKTVFAGGNAYGAKVGICSDWGENTDPVVGAAEVWDSDGALP